MSYNQALEKILFLELEEEEKKESQTKQNYLSTKTYVIVGAARIKQLTNELIALTSLNYQNLFMPYEQEALEGVAPYLIELKKEDDFTKWVYENVYGKQGAIFIHSSQQIDELSEHLRPHITTTTKIPNPKNKRELIEVEAYMRLYDPRVFPDFYYSLENRASFFREEMKVLLEDMDEDSILTVFNVEDEENIKLEEG